MKEGEDFLLSKEQKKCQEGEGKQVQKTNGRLNPSRLENRNPLTAKGNLGAM